ncbi:MAG: hypothetical protein PHN81_03475 [Actinomycetota bacterium]|nr:hypothetical protein [Actinomycetota bacterium]
MSKIVYIPELEKGRYLHLSYSGESCAIRDFIARGNKPCRDYQTSQIANMITDCFPADRVPVSNTNFWIERLKEVSKNKLGDRAVVDVALPIYKNNNNSVLKLSSEKLEQNDFLHKKPRVLFYGERGIVNTLFIELSNNKQAFCDFINSTITCQGNKVYDKEIDKYMIVIEPNFGMQGFGTPDAVITINDELLIMFEAKRRTFMEEINELTYQTDLNYSIGKHFTEIDFIPSVINLEPIYSSEANKQRGYRGGAFRKLYTNDEHKYFFADFIKCNKFSCLSLTTDRSEKQIADYYRNTNDIELKNLSWIGYDSIRKIVDKYNLEWIGAHLEMNKRHLGAY